ncbi:hypothetical protein EJK50_1672 [Moraxella catarrhalis]|nr:hypothetical protein EJK50_1672 [Moraxella catarrhalis]
MEISSNLVRLICWAICLTKAVLTIYVPNQAGRLHGWAKWVHGLKREPC